MENMTTLPASEGLPGASRRQIDACIDAIARRKAIIKLATTVIALSLFPLLWLLPVGIFDENAYGSPHGGLLLVWAWGWHSEAGGWFGTDPYILLFLPMALIYAAIMSVFLASQGIAARKGHRPGVVGVMLIFGAIYYFFMTSGWTCAFNPSVACSVHPISLVLEITFGSAGAAYCCFYKLHVPTSGERQLVQKAAALVSKNARNIQSPGSGEVGRGSVDCLRHDIAWIEDAARRAGVDIQDQIGSGKKSLANLEARCNMRDAIRSDGAISIDKLRAVSGLPAEQFLTLLMDMCRQLDLSTDGSVVAARHDQDAASLLREIDAYFAKWREAETSKLSKT